MSESFVVKEYQEISLQDIDCDLNKLYRYLKCRHLDSALKVTPGAIKATSWVGVIKYKNLHLEILPKLICDKDDNTQILSNLLFMLSYTKKLDIKTGNVAKLSKSKNPFIEVLIREFAQSLFDSLKRLTPKNYIREEENLNYLKGKLKFSENIRYNSTNQAKFYCEYDEYSENNILNQLFLYISVCLYSISKDNNNKKTLSFIINYYADIKLIKFDKFKASKIKLARNQELFKKAFGLAKMFIENTSVDLSKNKVENITLIWDMNKLFEEFVFEIMKKSENEWGWEFVAQKGRQLLCEDTNKKRNTFVDIYCTRSSDGYNIILDTKYKKLQSFDDFSNADVFQVSSYCLLHGVEHAILLYPRYDKEKPAIPDYCLNTDDKKYKINFKTVNLKYGNLKDELENIKDEIKEFLDAV